MWRNKLEKERKNAASSRLEDSRRLSEAFATVPTESNVDRVRTSAEVIEGHETCGSFSLTQ